MKILKINHEEVKFVRKNNISEIELQNKYFWRSRSVYAVEFKENIYDSANVDDIWNEMLLIQVQFEENIILSHDINFNDDYPINVNDERIYWVKDLLNAYIKDSWDSRTKQQFDNDFNNVIENLKNIR